MNKQCIHKKKYSFTTNKPFQKCILINIDVIFLIIFVCDPFEDQGVVLFRKTTASFSQNNAISISFEPYAV